jgi:truncated hemoglobin YjbI
MSQYSYPHYPTSDGYMTDKIRQNYIKIAIAEKVLPENAHRMAHIIALTASNDVDKTIQFWQLYSVLGPDRIVNIVKRFYEQVYDDEHWFSSVFSNIGDITSHTNSQSSMWIDVMGGGHAYHGGDYRLSFHHTHNAIQLMNDRGAQRWTKLMVATLNDPLLDITDDPRIRPSLNTFLAHFLGKYAEQFNFENNATFGETHPVLKRRINFMNMSEAAIASLTESELKEALIARGVDVGTSVDKQALVNQALRL